MDLLYSCGPANSAHNNHGDQMIACCSISSHNVLVFARQPSPGVYQAECLELSCPTVSHTVCRHASAITALAWFPRTDPCIACHSLMVGHSDGTWRYLAADEGYLNRWRLLHTGTLMNESILDIVPFSSCPPAIELVSDKATSLGDKYAVQHSTPPLTHTGGVAVAGFVALSSSGLLGVTHMTDTELCPMRHFQLNSRPRLVRVFSVVQSSCGAIYVATCDGAGHSTVHVHKFLLVSAHETAGGAGADYQLSLCEALALVTDTPASFVRSLRLIVGQDDQLSVLLLLTHTDGATDADTQQQQHVQSQVQRWSLVTQVLNVSAAAGSSSRQLSSRSWRCVARATFPRAQFHWCQLLGWGRVLTHVSLVAPSGHVTVCRLGEAATDTQELTVVCTQQPRDCAVACAQDGGCAKRPLTALCESDTRWAGCLSACGAIYVLCDTRGYLWMYRSPAMRVDTAQSLVAHVERCVIAERDVWDAVCVIRSLDDATLVASVTRALTAQLLCAADSGVYLVSALRLAFYLGAEHTLPAIMLHTLAAIARNTMRPTQDTPFCLPSDSLHSILTTTTASTATMSEVLHSARDTLSCVEAAAYTQCQYLFGLVLELTVDLLHQQTQQQQQQHTVSHRHTLVVAQELLLVLRRAALPCSTDPFPDTLFRLIQRHLAADSTVAPDATLAAECAAVWEQHAVHSSTRQLRAGYASYPARGRHHRYTPTAGCVAVGTHDTLRHVQMGVCGASAQEWVRYCTRCPVASAAICGGGANCVSGRHSVFRLWETAWAEQCVCGGNWVLSA